MAIISFVSTSPIYDLCPRVTVSLPKHHRNVVRLLRMLVTRLLLLGLLRYVGIHAKRACYMISCPYFAHHNRALNLRGNGDRRIIKSHANSLCPTMRESVQGTLSEY